jgi:hypothetical protein
MSDVFPEWTNKLPLKILIGAGLAGTAISAGCWYYFTPKHYRAGYQPIQPASFSHAVHAGKLGVDCRYCHRGVETSWHAGLPSAALCMNCHNQALRGDARLAMVSASAATGQPLAWTQVHRVPDFVYFNHAVHVGRGVSCVECHGPVHQMDEVRHHQSLSMTFCLDCHRSPAPRLRPLDKVTDLDWAWSQDPKEDRRLRNERGQEMAKGWRVEALQECSTCHR